jgi:hypothetical protein
MQHELPEARFASQHEACPVCPLIEWTDAPHPRSHTFAGATAASSDLDVVGSTVERARPGEPGSRAGR